MRWQWMCMVLMLSIAGAGQGVFAQATQPARTQPATKEQARSSAEQLQALHLQLDAMLTAAGLPRELNDANVPRELSRIARQAVAIARQTTQPTERLAARQLSLRAYHALAQQALQQQRSAEASYHLVQLRNGAYEARAVASPSARAVGDYWLLLADLVDIRRNTPDAIQREAASIRRLELALKQQDEKLAGAPEQRVQISLALLELYDQAGRTQDVCELARQLQQGGQAAALQRELGRYVADCELLGRQLDFTLPADAGAWSLRAQRGKLVAIYFAGARTDDQLTSALVKLAADHPDDFYVLELRRSLTPNGPAEAHENGAETNENGEKPAENWRKIAHKSVVERLAAALNVRPGQRVILLNGTGTVVAMGSSLSMVRVVRARLAEVVEKSVSVGGGDGDAQPMK